MYMHITESMYIYERFMLIFQTKKRSTRFTSHLGLIHTAIFN